MSQIISGAVLSAMDMPVEAGNLIRTHGTCAGQLLIALSAPDSDGFIRFAPLWTSGVIGQGFGIAIESADLGMGQFAGWLRLDRVGWQYFESVETVGTLKPAALARVHRLLCTQEARSYAQIAHRAPTFVPGRTAVLRRER